MKTLLFLLSVSILFELFKQVGKYDAVRATWACVTLALVVGAVHAFSRLVRYTYGKH